MARFYLAFSVRVNDGLCKARTAVERAALRFALFSSNSQNFGRGIFGRPVVVPLGAGCEPPVVAPPEVEPPDDPPDDPPGNVGLGIVGSPGIVEGITTGGNVDGSTGGGIVVVGAAVPVGCDVGVWAGVVGLGEAVAVGLAGVVGGGGGGVYVGSVVSGGGGVGPGSDVTLAVGGGSVATCPPSSCCCCRFTNSCITYTPPSTMVVMPEAMSRIEKIEGPLPLRFFPASGAFITAGPATTGSIGIVPPPGRTPICCGVIG